MHCLSNWVYRAGQALVTIKTSARQEAWDNFKTTNPLMQQLSSLHTAYQESESPLIMPIRSVTSTIGSWFEENEVAQVTRMMRGMDPCFTREAFERELREYIVPEVVDAYLSADKEALMKWCSEAVSSNLSRYGGRGSRFCSDDRRITSYGPLWSNICGRALSVTAKCSIFAKSMCVHLLSHYPVLLTMIMNRSQMPKFLKTRSPCLS